MYFNNLGKVKKEEKKMTTKTKRHLAAVKANRTRNARRNFIRRYGLDAYWIAMDISRGLKNDRVMDYNFISLGTVAAYRANLNRNNNFSRMAQNCNF